LEGRQRRRRRIDSIKLSKKRKRQFTNKFFLKIKKFVYNEYNTNNTVLR